MGQAENLTRAILEQNSPKNRLPSSTNRSFNEDAEFMERVKLMVIRSTDRSKEVHERVFSWALNKSKELRKKHFKA